MSFTEADESKLESETPLTDAHRLAVLHGLWNETAAGVQWAPLAIAAQRYEIRIRAKGVR